MIRVRYFAALRESLGEGEAVPLDGLATVGELRDRLIGLSAAHAHVLARHRLVRCALDQSLCDESARLYDNAEVAFFPPVTGG